MAENLMTKAWALDFMAHRWEGPDGQEEKFSTSNVKFVALAIARASLMNGACWASQATLSEVTGLSTKTVHRCVQEMVQCGWMRLVERRRADGGRSTNKMWLTLPAVTLNQDTLPAKPQRFLPGEHADEVDSEGVPLDTVALQVPPSGLTPSDSESGAYLKGDSKGKEGRDSGRAKEDGTQGPDLDSAVGLIWQRASEQGRRRSSRADIRKALDAALKRGHPIERILKGLGAYFASPDATKDDGAYQRGAHVMLANDRWESFLDDAQARQERQDASPAAQEAREVTGTLEEPSEAMQRMWMELYGQGMPWNPERGPAPGRLGCRVAPALQREFGVEPYGAPPADDAGAFD